MSKFDHALIIIFVCSKLEKWLRWFEAISKEIQQLVIAKHIYHEVQKIVRSNSALHKESYFYDYFVRTYTSHVLIGVRRQIKTDNKSITIRRLFDEMIESPTVLQRSWFISKYENSPAGRYADDHFDRFSFPGLQHINPGNVKLDLELLLDVTQKCEDFADRRIAHYDKRGLRDVLTFNDISESIDLLDELCVKYQVLFQQRGIVTGTMLPQWQYDWKEIFHMPWINDEL